MIPAVQLPVPGTFTQQQILTQWQRPLPRVPAATISSTELAAKRIDQRNADAPLDAALQRASVCRALQEPLSDETKDNGPVGQAFCRSSVNTFFEQLTPTSLTRPPYTPPSPTPDSPMEEEGDCSDAFELPGMNAMANTQTSHKPIDDKETMDANVGPIGAALQRASLAAAFELQDVQTGPVGAALRRASLAAANNLDQIRGEDSGEDQGIDTIMCEGDSIERMSISSESDAHSRFSESRLSRNPFQAIDALAERLSVDDTIRTPVLPRWGSRELMTMPKVEEEKSWRRGNTRPKSSAEQPSKRRGDKSLLEESSWRKVTREESSKRRGDKSLSEESSYRRRGDKSLLEESSWRKPTRAGEGNKTLGNDLAVADQKNLRVRI